MPEIETVHIEQISRYIRHQDICFSHLPDELIDHVCCDVEEEMRLGLNFAEAWKLVRHRIGRERLREIQEETLLAVDTKYRNMKNTMKITGVLGTVMISFAALFKIMHLPGASILLTLGALVLVSLFLPASLVVLWKESHSGKRVFLFVSGFITGASYILGALFKIQHWPGSGILISLAVVSGVLLFLPALLVFRLRETDLRGKKPAYIIGAIGVLAYLVGFWFRIMHWPLASILVLAGSAIIFLVAFPWYTYITWKETEYVKAKFIFMVVAPLLCIVPAGLVSLNVTVSYDSTFSFFVERQVKVGDFIEGQNNLFIGQYTDSADYEVLAAIDRQTKEAMATIEKIIKDAGPEVSEETAQPAIAQVLDEYVAYLESTGGNIDLDAIRPLVDADTYFRGYRPLNFGLEAVMASNSVELLINGILTAENYVLKQVTTKK